MYKGISTFTSEAMSSRIDVWDQKKHREHTPVSCGYPAGFEEKYELGDELGRGGFGVVRVVSKKKNGKQYAAKSIKKVLEVPNLSIDRQAAHLANIKREISVLYRLRGTLNIVHFKEALEDDEYVHIVMELCRGGELSHSLAKRHYSEKTVRRLVMRCCMSGNHAEILFQVVLTWPAGEQLHACCAAHTGTVSLAPHLASRCQAGQLHAPEH